MAMITRIDLANGVIIGEDRTLLTIPTERLSTITDKTRLKTELEALAGRRITSKIDIYRMQDGTVYLATGEEALDWAKIEASRAGKDGSRLNG